MSWELMSYTYFSVCWRSRRWRRSRVFSKTHVQCICEGQKHFYSRCCFSCTSGSLLFLSPEPDGDQTSEGCGMDGITRGFWLPIWRRCSNSRVIWSSLLKSPQIHRKDLGSWIWMYFHLDRDGGREIERVTGNKYCWRIPRLFQC